MRVVFIEAQGIARQGWCIWMKKVRFETRVYVEASGVNVARHGSSSQAGVHFARWCACRCTLHELRVQRALQRVRNLQWSSGKSRKT